MEIASKLTLLLVALVLSKQKIVKLILLGDISIFSFFLSTFEVSSLFYGLNASNIILYPSFSNSRIRTLGMHLQSIINQKLKTSRNHNENV